MVTGRAMGAAVCAALLAAGASPAAGKTDDTPPKENVPVVAGERMSARFVDLIAHDTFGVAKVVVVRFAGPVQRRAAAVNGLSVTVRGAEQPLVGAWQWLDSRTVAYRPKKWWPEKSSVTVTVDLADVVPARNADFGAHQPSAASISSSLSPASTSTSRLWAPNIFV